jgi:ABC-type nitrate/sulfonate/bicarbonate transport system substrate-binding protein
MLCKFKFRWLLLVAVGLALRFGADVHAQQRVAASYPGIAGYNIPFWVALDAGEFKKAGLEVDAVMISGGSKSMQALLSGGLDFAYVSGGVSVQANLSGADVTILATAANSMSAGVIAAKDVKSYQDLRGKKIGIASFGGSNDIGLRFAFKKNGINPDKDVTFLQLGGERNRLTALERGAISATIMSPPGLFVAEAQGYSRLGDLNTMGMRYPELSIVARKRDLRDRRDLVRRYLRAYLESVRVMKSNRDLTVRVIEKYIHVGSKAEALKTYDYFVKSISDTLRTEREGITEFLATLEAKTPGVSKRNPNEFIDESVLEEVLKAR